YGWVRTFARITLPLIRPSIVASWMLLFSIFITELSMVILLYTAETRTFSVLSFEVWNVGNFSQVASLSLLQLVIGVAVLQTVQLLWPQRNVHGGPGPPLPLAGRGRGWGFTNSAPSAGTPPLAPPRQGEGNSVERAARFRVAQAAAKHGEADERKHRREHH